MKETKGINKFDFLNPFSLFKKNRRVPQSIFLNKHLIEIYDNLKEPVFQIDGDKKIIWKNKAFLSFFKNTNIEYCYQICGNSAVQGNCKCLNTLSTGHIENNFIELNSDSSGIRIFAEMISIPLKAAKTEEDSVVVIIKEQNNFTFSSNENKYSLINDSSQPIGNFESLKKYEIEDNYDLLKRFVINLNGVTYQRDLQLRMLFIEGAFEEITGFARNDLIENKINWNDLIKNEDLNKYNASLENIRKHPNSEGEIDYRITCKDGTEKWIKEKMMNVFNIEKKERFIYGFLYDITERKKAEENLKISREELRNLALYIESSREEEKKRIAKDIHDELGHALTALKLELMWLIKKKYLRQDVLYERTRKMNELIESTIRKVRSISSELRPSVLDHFGLVAAIEWQAAEFQKRSAMRCKVVVPNQELNLNEKYSTAIFRIFQEILTNIARHSKATRVDVHLEVVNNELKLRVSDNGRGIKQENINSRKSFGLIGMYERATALGGKLNISGVSGIGTTVTLIIPLK